MYCRAFSITLSKPKLANACSGSSEAKTILTSDLRIEPEQALRATNDRFMRRFAYIEQALQRQGKKLKESSLAEMDALWQEAKDKKK